ncbi:aryl-alcohol dehydrogenase [Cryptococcus neoformans]|uniref:Aryl-alcohol dehydrogenase n=2 Tax=Cryptococcus neoformans TaxID=5207 RepID=A0A854QI55_CRYNE|nr:aryl-alcohol dehydrogenase [Cryptococcus neoformans var. grubii H99]AUB28253.1 aryl-alcohol dehydrogenase [Cryptococcus neoformans var. grubii]OWZ56144.1 aryl-alcohol dehydrogenase [Cryptococcus neoformans var. grubii 125.91]OXG24998.1 aryl-alcohol dehydrogenase [Cryptococcus neoformans var. grubii Tu259-1]OXG45052.1 aryl-alcohol dehydrogenase [Cryptococcus neoformans var. grubii Th84]OXG51817.1 aryl-alcohol dehydrogenase [Cryptococcus neoformans var. grubii CHC193]OXG78179.1 aryl-alcohol |eukprot:XP_012052869.1 aryl-alcohol dehydrogenase [Cryptococcus neoformans var. grubii H99]
MTSENKMQYVRLGKSGLKISKIILGCMSYGDPEWHEWVLREKEGIEHIKYAYAHGINTFDTADISYSCGASEEILGKAIREIGCPREDVVILTKLYMPITHGSRAAPPAFPDLDKSGYTNQYGLSRKHIFAAVQASLKRLNVEYIDVLQCHRFDYNTPIEETMQALHDVVQKGWVRYIGMSSCWAYQFHAMQNYAINNGLTAFISMQNFHNAAYREEEREMIPTLQMFGVGCIPWSPLARGFLTRPWKDSTSLRSQSDALYKARGFSDPAVAKQRINEAIEQIAEKRGISMAQVALAWSLSKEYITAPIVGTTSLDKLKDLLGAINLKLTQEEKKAIEEHYVPQDVTGHQ